MSMPERKLSLAALTVLELSPPEMVEVAARAGYSHVGLRLVPATPQEHHFALVADRELRRQTRQRLADTGLQVLDVEILRLQPDTQVSDFEAVLAVGAECGASELLVAGNDPDRTRLTERFATLCELAAPYGLHPHLEFMPWTDVPDLPRAIDVVNAAQRDNGCVLVDAFHFDRSGSQLADLAQLAPSRLRYAQLCDVPGPRPSDMAEILRQARSERRFPGDGCADLLGLLRCLPAQIPLSLEIPTRHLLEQGVSALQRAQMAMDKTQRLLQQL